MSDAAKKLTKQEAQYIEQACHELFDSLTESFGSLMADINAESANAIYSAIAEFYLANKRPNHNGGSDGC